MIHGIAAVGDAASPHCWSGIPYHFGEAARAAGHPAVPWRVDVDAFKVARWYWNAGRVLAGRGVGGFQYSPTFLNRAEAAIPGPHWTGRVLSFQQHFPRANSVIRRGGRLVYYVDCTFKKLSSPDGTLGQLPNGTRERACALEQQNYEGSEWVVTMSRWAKSSVIRGYGIRPEKVATILPGANLTLPEDFGFSTPDGLPGRDRPLVLGFVGKDWKRKGLPFLMEVWRVLAHQGVKAVVRCAGNCPVELSRKSGLEYVGFIDKVREPERFLPFLTQCDLGCLFSQREPLGISTLEFLRAGVPVTGFDIEGMADTIPPDAGLSFAPDSSAEEVATAIRMVFQDEGRVQRMRAAARRWSPLLGWERCVREWQELLSTGGLCSPVQLWRGMQPASQSS